MLSVDHIIRRPSKTLGFYLKKVDEAVSKALEENPDAEIILLAHSIGGASITYIFYTREVWSCDNNRFCQTLMEYFEND